MQSYEHLELTHLFEQGQLRAVSSKPLFDGNSKKDRRNHSISILDACVSWHYHCCHANSDLALSALGLAIKRWMNSWIAQKQRRGWFGLWLSGWKAKKDYYISLDCLLDCRRRHMSEDSSVRKKILSLALSIASSSYYTIFRVLLLRLWHLVHMLWNFPYRSPLSNEAAGTFSSKYKIAIVFVRISIDALSLRRLPEWLLVRLTLHF